VRSESGVVSSVLLSVWSPSSLLVDGGSGSWWWWRAPGGLDVRGVSGVFRSAECVEGCKSVCCVSRRAVPIEVGRCGEGRKAAASILGSLRQDATACRMLP